MTIWMPASIATPRSPVLLVIRRAPSPPIGGLAANDVMDQGKPPLGRSRFDFPDRAIANPGHGTDSQVVILCRQCHSPLGKELSRSDPLAVRFPGTNLTWSRCYSESGGALGCVTCHNPHRNAEKTASYYEARCLSCHSNPTVPPPHLPGTVDKVRQIVCSVSPNGGCLPCHMPNVKTAIPHSSFTDHNIRIRSRSDTGSTVRQNNKLPNSSLARVAGTSSARGKVLDVVYVCRPGGRHRHLTNRDAVSLANSSFPWCPSVPRRDLHVAPALCRSGQTLR